MAPSSDLFLGIDVQTSRACSYVVLDRSAGLVTCGWLTGEAPPARQARLLVESEIEGSEAVVGIDAPRRPLPDLRRWYREGDRWRRLDAEDGKRGRHGELVLSALGIANPQWTPLEEDAPGWMRLGFGFYRQLEATDARVHEVFPSASYHMLGRTGERLRTGLPYAELETGIKDLIDAFVAAETVRRFHRGEGDEVGGEDGFGTIVLPTELRPAERQHPVHDWPGASG